MIYKKNASTSALDLLDTDLVTPNTRFALLQRLYQPAVIYPTFFDAEKFETLKAVCDQLIPQNDKADKIDLAGMLDMQLAKGKGNGWRYSEMPSDKNAFKLGIVGIDETSVLMFGIKFIGLDDKQKVDVLTVIQKGNADGQTWIQMPAKLFFEELLTSVVELYYSHPIAKNEIDDMSFADAKGWQNIGLTTTDK